MDVYSRRENAKYSDDQAGLRSRIPGKEVPSDFGLLMGLGRGQTPSGV